MHMRPIFRALGVPAAYQPPGTDARIPCRVVRGAPVLTLDGIEVDAGGYDALRADFTPEPGGVLWFGGAGVILAAGPLPHPPENDPEQALWRIPAWRSGGVYEATEGAGPAMRPPNVMGARLAQDAAAGETVIDIIADYAAGALRAGDVLWIDGRPHTVRGDAAASGDGFAAVAVAALDRDFVAGAEIGISPVSGSYAVGFRLLSLRDDSLAGLSAAGAIALVGHQDLIHAGWASPAPSAGHHLSFRHSNERFRIVAARAVIGAGSSPVAWELRLGPG